MRKNSKKGCADRIKMFPFIQDLCMLGDFVEDQDNSPVQLEDLDAQTTTFHDILLDPWKPTLFDDILLDQVRENVF